MGSIPPGVAARASPEGSVGLFGTFAPAVWLVFPAEVRLRSLVGTNCDEAGCGGLREGDVSGLVGYSGIWRPEVARDALVFLGRAFAEFNGDELVAFVGRAELES